VFGLRGILTYVYKGFGFFDADEIKDVSALLWYFAELGFDLRAVAFLRSRFVRLFDVVLACFGPWLAAVVMDPWPFESFAVLGCEDRRVLEYVCRCFGEWFA